MGTRDDYEEGRDNFTNNKYEVREGREDLNELELQKEPLNTASKETYYNPLYEQVFLQEVIEENLQNNSQPTKPSDDRVRTDLENRIEFLAKQNEHLMKKNDIFESKINFLSQQNLSLKGMNDGLKTNLKERNSTMKEIDNEYNGNLVEYSSMSPRSTSPRKRMDEVSYEHFREASPMKMRNVDSPKKIEYSPTKKQIFLQTDLAAVTNPRFEDNVKLLKGEIDSLKKDLDGYTTISNVQAEKEKEKLSTELEDNIQSFKKKIRDSNYRISLCETQTDTYSEWLAATENLNKNRKKEI